MHACYVFWFSLDSLVALAVSRSSLERFFVPMLQGIAACRGNSNFFLAFFDGLFKFSIFRSDETDTSQFSSIVELWLLNTPFLA